MMCRIDWPLVVEFLKVLPPVSVAAAVGWVAYQQWKTAKDKLALDLFDRRYRAIESINAQLQILSRESGRDLEGRPSIFGEPSSAWPALLKEVDQARYLFGQPLADKWLSLMRETEQMRDAVATALVKRGPEDVMEKNYMSEAMESKGRAAALEREINDLVAPFMMMDSISVSRPRKR